MHQAAKSRGLKGLLLLLCLVRTASAFNISLTQALHPVDLDSKNHRVDAAQTQTPQMQPEIHSQLKARL
jgi:hypothetical protein